MERDVEFVVTTGYLTEALDLGGPRAHQVTITARPTGDAEGELVLDPNACTLDSFGDPRLCTLIAVLPHRATLRLLSEDEGKALFAIDAEGYAGPPLRLSLVHGQESEDEEGPLFARLLVLDEHGAIRRLVTMEPPRGRLVKAA
jgi:hypothetical protein